MDLEGWSLRPRKDLQWKQAEQKRGKDTKAFYEGKEDALQGTLRSHGGQVEVLSNYGFQKQGVEICYPELRRSRVDECLRNVGEVWSSRFVEFSEESTTIPDWLGCCIVELSTGYIQLKFLAFPAVLINPET